VQPAAGSTNAGGDGERHHAVIVFADVVGYSRLMADDEPGTLNRWTALYKNVLKPEAERRRGQVGDLRGDGTLLEFEQVADALDWSRLAHRAPALTGIGDTAPLALHVAIHQGTVFSTREGLSVLR
jgi:adenylate cyclase